jgi:hypothetical protein
VVLKLKPLLLLGCLLGGACTDPPPSRPPQVPVAPAAPSVAQSPPSTPTPAPVCDFEAVRASLPVGENDEAALGQWTPWRIDTCALKELGELPEEATTALPENTAYSSSWVEPVRVANATGRNLFIVQTNGNYVSLLETQPGRYRACQLGRANELGGLSYQLCPRRRPRLLVLTKVEGYMGHGHCASGESFTRLQVYDLAHDNWLLNAPLGRYQTTLSCENDSGQEVPGRETGVQRYCRVADDGQTILLGYYADNLDEGAPVRDSAATMPPSIFGSEAGAAAAYPPGTYQLRGSRYQRIK